MPLPTATPPARPLQPAGEQPTADWRSLVGKIVLGVIIGIVLVLWLLVACVQALF
ncbi:MAG TPA: hypothetical protein VFY43_08695 [Candidatus Limnocylindria bacterium]|nr:hypothetical protein [Candidatus Limnocylindria bacterium]